MSFKPTTTLTLQDAVNNETYTLQVSYEDYVKAEADLNFAEALLFHARATHANNKTLAVPHCEQEVETVEDDIYEPDYVNELHDDDTTNSYVEETNQEHTNNKKCWSYEETLCLLNSMEVHMDSLNHPKKKKGVFEQVANDLCSNGFTVNAEQCQAKWKSLIRSYKVCKDHKTKTGRGPARFNFFEQMDLLLGSKPSNKCSHTLEASEETEITASTTIQETEQGFSEAELTLEKPKRKRANQESSDLKTLIVIKKEEYKRRDERHREKCALEGKKIELLSKILDKQ